MSIQLVRPSPPWKRPSLGQLLTRWTEDRRISSCLVLDRTLPEKEGRYEDLPSSLSEGIAVALRRRGVAKLYAHQREAFELATAGKHVVVATPTASGKSLCYHLPVLQRLASDRGTRALYLFPTKALARDQEESLRALLRDASLDGGAITFDGDTPGDVRRAAKERAALVLTNPDMLHAGILPHHASWARLFANLSYVVIDELHTYRGVFGSHLANVIRRLRRVARFHGSNPTFLFASATIGNPKEHAGRILGDDVVLVSESGAPEGARRVLVYDPPVINPELGLRASYLKSSVRLTADLVRANVPTLVFGGSRNAVELMLKYVREAVLDDGVPADAIQAYRGGYLPETRRRTEESLRAGTLRCVVATNALELGIDIGSLDAVVCAGYPGTVAGLLQRFGRAGRRKEGSLALLVTSSAPLDQFVARDAHRLLDAPVEHARIDPDNVEVLISQLKCAAFELPFADGDGFGDVQPEAIQDALGFLAEHAVVHPVSSGTGRVFHWTSDAYPASHVPLRSVSWDNFVVVERSDRATSGAEAHAIAELDFRAAHTMLHEQAIYQHEGEQYQVEQLDFENHKAFVRKVAADYYTEAQTFVRVTVLDQAAACDTFRLGTAHGDVSVVEKVVGYKKIKFHTHENCGYGDVRLPEMQMHTTAIWVTWPERVVLELDAPRPEALHALRGIGHALTTVAAVGLMVDPRDLGRAFGSRSGDGGGGTNDGVIVDPTIFLYDHVPGGVGLAPRLFEDALEVLRRTRASIDGCPCTSGCPGCIGPASGTDVGTRRKELALLALQVGGVPATP